MIHEKKILNILLKADMKHMNSPLNLSETESRPGCTLTSCYWLYSPVFAFIPPFLCLFSIHPSIHPSSFSSARSQNRSGLLGEQNTEAFLQHHPVSGELVIGGEAGRVGRAGGLPIRSHLLLVTTKEAKSCLKKKAQLTSVLEDMNTIFFKDKNHIYSNSFPEIVAADIIIIKNRGCIWYFRRCICILCNIYISSLFSWFGPVHHHFRNILFELLVFLSVSFLHFMHIKASVLFYFIQFHHVCVRPMSYIWVHLCTFLV